MIDIGVITRRLYCSSCCCAVGVGGIVAVRHIRRLLLNTKKHSAIIVIQHLASSRGCIILRTCVRTAAVSWHFGIICGELAF